MSFCEPELGFQPPWARSTNTTQWSAVSCLLQDQMLCPWLATWGRTDEAFKRLFSTKTQAHGEVNISVRGSPRSVFQQVRLFIHLSPFNDGTCQ